MNGSIYCIDGKFAEFKLNSEQLNNAVFKSGVCGYILQNMGNGYTRYICGLRDADKIAAVLN